MKEAFDLLGEYVADQGYDLRFAIEPKPNEPRGDILLPTVGHALAFIETPGAARAGRRQPGDRPRGDGRAELRRTASPRRCGGASCSTSTSTARAARVRPGPALRRRQRARRLLAGRPAGDRRATTGPLHFDFKPPRTEDVDGVWASAARLHAQLPDPARSGPLAFRADPEVQEALRASRLDELAQPTARRRAQGCWPTAPPRGLRRRGAAAARHGASSASTSWRWTICSASR